MISYSMYKVLHLTGVLMVFLAVGGVAVNAINDGTKKHRGRKIVGMTHGVGLLLSLVGGFGLLARLGISHGELPGWAIAKFLIWVIFAAIITALYRMPRKAPVLWMIAIVLGGTAAYLAGSKPF